MGKDYKDRKELEPEIISDNEIPDGLVDAGDLETLICEGAEIRAKTRRVFDEEDALFFANRILQGKDKKIPQKRPGEKDGEYALRVEIFRSAQKSILDHREAKKRSVESYDFRADVDPLKDVDRVAKKERKKE